MGIVDEIEWEDANGIDLLEYDEFDSDYADRIRVKGLRNARKAWRNAD